MLTFKESPAEPSAVVSTVAALNAEKSNISPFVEPAVKLLILSTPLLAAVSANFIVSAPSPKVIVSAPAPALIVAVALVNVISLISIVSASLPPANVTTSLASPFTAVHQILHY